MLFLFLLPSANSEPYYEFWSNDSLKIRGEYLSDKKHGKWEYYNLKGKVWKYIIYENGKKVDEMKWQIFKPKQSEIDALEIGGESGGGLVRVVVSGKKILISIDVNPELMKEDKEMLEDLVLVAVNQALEKVDKISQEKMGSLTGGMNIPGLF